MPGVPSLQLSQSTATRCARIRKLEPSTADSMTAGSASLSPRLRWAGSAMGDIKDSQLGENPRPAHSRESGNPVFSAQDIVVQVTPRWVHCSMSFTFHALFHFLTWRSRVKAD